MNGKPLYSTLSRCPVLLDHYKGGDQGHVLGVGSIPAGAGEPAPMPVFMVS